MDREAQDVVAVKQLYARVIIGPNYEQQRLEIRKKRYRRMLLQRGIRPASVERYLQRGFPSWWSRMLKKEMQRLVLDIKYRRGWK